jgi:hypothetical protein
MKNGETSGVDGWQEQARRSPVQLGRLHRYLASGRSDSPPSVSAAEVNRDVIQALALHIPVVFYMNI